MATFKTLLWIGFILFIVAISILFSLQNSTPIALDLLVASMPPLPVSVWILVSFSAGAILGLLAGGFAVLKLRSSNHLLRRKLQQAAKLHQVDNARAKSVSSEVTSSSR